MATFVGRCPGALRELVVNVSGNGAAHPSYLTPFLQALLFGDGAPPRRAAALTDLHVDVGDTRLSDEHLATVGTVGSLPALRRVHLGLRRSVVRRAAVESLLWLRLSPVEELYLDLRDCSLRAEDWDALQGLCTVPCLHVRLDQNERKRTDLVRLCGMLYRADARTEALHLHVAGEPPPGSFWLLHRTEPRLRLHHVAPYGHHHPVVVVADPEHHGNHNHDDA